MSPLFRRETGTAGRIILSAVAGIFLAAGIFSLATKAGASASLTGTVKNLADVGVANVTVCVNGPSGECAVTDSGGNYSMTLLPGHYRGRTQVPTGVDYGGAAEREFDVYEGTNAPIDWILTTLQLKGQLLRADSTPIQGWVNVHTQDWTTSARADAGGVDGAYTIGGLATGNYIVEAGAFNNISGVVPPDPVTIYLDSGSKTLNLVFGTSTKTLTGNVRKGNGTVVTNACINANKLNGATNARSQTDGSGNYSLALTGGSWNISINPCSPDADWIPGSPMQIDFVNDTSIESKSLNFTVTVATATITGTIRDNLGNLITSGDIDVRNASGSGAHAQVQSNGTFTVRLTAGTYEVRYWSPSNVYNLPATTVSVADNQTVTLNLVATIKSAHIKGCVRTRAGAPAVNVPINAWQMTSGGGGPGGWSNTRSAADCTYDLLVTAGRWGMNIMQEPGSSYVLVSSGPPMEVTVSSDTATVTDINFTVDVADVTITGAITSGGQPIPNAGGCVFARLAGTYQENCGPIDQRSGTYTLKVSSANGTSYEIGCHFPPNMPFSCGAPITINVTPGATINQNIDLIQNNSAIVGKLFDSTGFPLTSCEFLKGGMVFADGSGAHYQGQIEPNCSYRISLIAGVYNVGAFFPPESGALNPPPGTPVQVFSGQTVEKNIQFTKADATITVSLLAENGVGTQGFINVDNSEEINMSREGNSGSGPGGQPGFDKKSPCNAKDMAGVLKCCSNTKNKSACKAFTVPNGPKNCKNAWDCAQVCKKTPSICKDALNQNKDSGPQPGQGDFKTGPGGCKTEAACQQYCSVPANQNECAKFAPPPGVMSKSVRISSLMVRRLATTTKPGLEAGPSFDKAIRSNGPTDFNGQAKISVLSGHRYKVCAGLPPQTNAMPPKCQSVDLTNTKTASVILQLRAADATMSGVVTHNGNPMGRCFVHAWAEDGSFSGQPCEPNGRYSINLTKDTTWHIGADSFEGISYYRSDEITKVVITGTKKYTQNIALKKQAFDIPIPVSTSGTCSATLTLSLSNGAKIELPGGALSTSTDGTCSCTASPTIDLVATKANQPEGVGYTIDCRNENGTAVIKLLSSATVTLPYKIRTDQEGTAYEDALQAVFYDTTLGAYKTIDNCTKNETNNTFACRVDHFSSYTVANATGSSSGTNALKSVTTAKAKNGTTYFTVNNKKITPFPSCRGDVSVVTKSVKGTQLIAAASSCEGKIKVYDIKGKLKANVALPTNSLAGLTFADVNKDGHADIIAPPNSGTDIWVINAASKYRTATVNVTNRATKLTTSAIDFRGNGIYSLVAATVTNGTAGNFRIYDYQRGVYRLSSTSYGKYLTNAQGRISLSIPKPIVTAIKGTIKKTAPRAKITITGQNFTPDTTVLVGRVGAKNTFKSSTELQLTVNGTQLTAGKYALKLTNPGGQATNTKLKVTVK